MDYLVVAERQNELLREGVDQGEGQLAVVPTAVNRVFSHVTQGVVHPPHVPLEAKAQATLLGGGGNARPGGGLLSAHDDTRVLAVSSGVGFLQEADSFKVLATTVLVGAPLAVVTRVVQVKHGSYGVHTQAVYVELF